MSARDRKAYVVCVCLGMVVATLALLRDLQILHDFSREASKLAPGTEIRPIGVALARSFPELGGVLLGFCCFTPAIVLAWRGKSLPRIMLALVIFALSFVPITVVGPKFMQVVHESGLVLAE